ncbi:RadC family protein [Salimicrobium halophilum]|uniref:DNA replication and repair protein RadC n=1 Tax=Salimicrobium halophilum TaxID=86666 RepID=A0A1G8PJV7_9BACI|nr:DNA repair protein RadC [Salimicrobium halophilum]SDI92672.1 DNA replication and repair protein RadC [Salimicrobium halophilum]
MNKVTHIRGEGPREKLVTYGADRLTMNELLAVLLSKGTKGMPIDRLSHEILVYLQGTEGLREATVDDLTTIEGVGPAKAVQLIAAMELGRRVHYEKREEGFLIRSPEDGAEYVMEEMRHLKQEHFVALFLDVKNRVISKRTVFVGSLNSSIVHPRELFKEAVKRSAASIVCVHNHPSGDPSPSQEDIQVTKRLSECGKLLGIELLDHLVIGDSTFISLKEKGYL